jgi:seryl-tRNA synthetase
MWCLHHTDLKQTHAHHIPCPSHLQSRRLDIRLRTPKAPGQEEKKAFVHMLNSTLTATERTLCCLLENYQTPDGVRVPPVLQPYMMGIDFVPFRKAFDAKGKLVERKAESTASTASMSTS